MLPAIIAGATGISIEDSFVAWKDRRLHGKSGYGRKLKFAVREALADGLRAVVAVVDQDKARPRERLAELVAARSADRTTGIQLPISVGEARPHGEAWLLDDQVAVKATLGIPATAAIPAVTKCRSPKDELNELCSKAGQSYLTALRQIAAMVQVSRCPHAKQTGLQEFVDDVTSEFRMLAGSA